ncbi:MAG: 4-hydroxy-tetrahydrodipicolinate reductase [Chloroflexota bacterium]
MIRVAVAGALGRMGREVVRTVEAASDLEYVAGVTPRPPAPEGGQPGQPGAKLASDLREAIYQAGPDVLVDFTVAEAAVENAIMALELGVRPVIGTSGITPAQLDQIGRLSREKGVGAVVAPNFAVGAVLLMHFARIASHFFDAAEVIELHHEKKIDAPSGTAMATAQEMAQAHGRAFITNTPSKESLPGSRGATWEGVRVHSVRLPGLVAHQEVLFGAPGQILTLRHDSTDRVSFMQGVLLAVRGVMALDRLVVGLDNLLDLRP